MAFLTEAEVIKRAERVIKSRHSITAALESASTDWGFDVFLSHSSKDGKKILIGVKDYLEENGLSVYIDLYNDPDLSPDNVTLETATRLRERLISSRYLVYIYSQHSTLSRWMPWELGFMSGMDRKVGVFPVGISPELIYKREEFLGLYPYIDNICEDRSDKKIFYINDRFGNSATLNGWINGSEDITDEPDELNFDWL